MASFDIIYALSHSLVYFAIALIFSGFIMLVGYGVYDLWPQTCWPKSRLTIVPQYEPWIRVRGTPAEVDRITDFLISEQEAATRNGSNKLSTASSILWWAVDDYTDDMMKVSLAKKASTAMMLKFPREESYQLVGSSECASDITLEQDTDATGIKKDAQLAIKSKPKRRTKR